MKISDLNIPMEPPASEITCEEDKPVHVVTYNGVPISYSERDNTWSFELFGKEYKLPSLREAKNFVDRPPRIAKPEHRDFQRQVAIYFRGDAFTSDEPKKVIVTSLCATRDYDKSKRYWVTHPGESKFRKRETVSSRHLFPDCEENKKLLADWCFLESQTKELTKRQAAILKKLLPFDP